MIDDPRTFLLEDMLIEAAEELPPPTSATDLANFVRDLERYNLPPFRYEDTELRFKILACEMRRAALANDARLVAAKISKTRLERLWRIECWLTHRHRRHPRIAAWLDWQLGGMRRGTWT